MTSAPSEAAAYLHEVARRLRALLGDELVGVYAGGSYALGDYRPGRSDLDVAVVCRGPLPVETKHAIVGAVRHESLPCPARGLELVVYPERTVRGGTGEPGYELELNTGRAMPLVVSFSPEGEEHWYAIDRAVVREHGAALAGPPPAQLFAPIARDVLLGRVTESVRWHAEEPWARADDAVLNACRAWRFASDGIWSSKRRAGEWALTVSPDAELVAAALHARAVDGTLERDGVDRFLADVVRRLGEARAGGSLHS